MVTVSGLVIDEFGRILGNDFRPIPGLLAAGTIDAGEVVHASA